VNGDRIGSVLVQLTESTPCTSGEALTQHGLTFDLNTGRFFDYSNLFRSEGRGLVDKLIFSFLPVQCLTKPV
jgi:hypothetical protein